MLKEYLIVNKEVLPDVFEKVIQVKRMMQQGEEDQISEAVKKVGLSRSAYYKYKDHIFETSENVKERKAVLSFMLSHEKGLLSEVLQVLSNEHCNILTINQNIPIHGKASVTISVDISDLEIGMEDVIHTISSLKGVNRVNLIALE